MVFDHYKERGAVLAADIVNTTGSVTGRELLQDQAAVDRFLREQRFSPAAPVQPTDVARFRGLRDRLRAIFFAEDDASTAALLNELLDEIGAIPQVAAADGAWRLGFAPSTGGPVQEMAVAATLGLAALFADSGRSRFGICSADDCRDVFIDTSKNRSRRYCADSCSSRTNVAAYRARKRTS